MSAIKKAKVVTTTPVKKPKTLQEAVKPWLIPFRNFWVQASILIVIGLAFYYTSFDGEYALDDGIVIAQNEYVQKGFSGIGEILSKDAYDSFYKQMGSSQQLSGGRYRPLSIVTFAIEQQLFTDSVVSDSLSKAHGYRIPSKAMQLSMPEGKDHKTYLANIRHVINVFFYILSAVLLLYFLREFILKSNYDIAFLASLLFLTHPIHTEVVANVKSRDEIVSFLFMILTLHFAFAYVERKKLYQLGLGLFFYFLSLLSKEYTITLVVLIPAMFYVFKKSSLYDSVKSSLPFLAIAVLYLLIRFSIVGKGLEKENPEVLNNPYLYTQKDEKLATEISTLDNYFFLLVFPHPLSSDYSYAQIPYRKFFQSKNGHSPLPVWISLALHLSMVWLGWKYLKKRHIIGFSILVYLVFLAMVGNIFMDIGATMGERLIYHSSFGFCLAASWLLVMGLHKVPGSLLIKRLALFAFLVPVILLYGAKTHERNADWQSDITLFTKDVETVPNSVLANGNAGARCIDMADMVLVYTLDKATMKIEKASGEFELILGYKPSKVEGNSFYDYISSEDQQKIKNEIASGKKEFSVEMAFKSKKKDIQKLSWQVAVQDEKIIARADNRAEFLKRAIGYLNKALTLHPKYVNGYLNLGLANYKLKNLEASEAAWMQAKRLFPSNPYLRNFLPLLSAEFIDRAFKKADKKDFVGALQDIEKATQMDPGNFKNYYHLGGAYFTLGQYDKAREAWTKCLQLKPDYEEARKGLAALGGATTQAR